MTFIAYIIQKEQKSVYILEIWNKEDIPLTIIEFYDPSQAENVATYLACKEQPDKVIIIGTERELTRERFEKLEKFIDKKSNGNTKAERKAIPDYELSKIIDILEVIIKENEECHFDVTGGGELALIAIGCILERHKYSNAHIHQFNIVNQEVEDIDSDGKVIDIDEAKISVRENVWLQGGEVFYDDYIAGGTHKWDFSDITIRNYIKKAWNINKADTKKWNTALSGIAHFNGDPSLHCVYQNENASQVSCVKNITLKLRDAGLITNLSVLPESVSFDYINDDVKRILGKAGTVLELYTGLTAYSSVDGTGNRVFNSVETGVYIDWDGDDTTMTTNEIDVILMKKIIPVFISCKNGAVSVDELYKFNSVANEFGSKYVKKILITNELTIRDARGFYSRSVAKTNQFEMRAAELGISIIKNVNGMSQAAFRSKLISLI